MLAVTLGHTDSAVVLLQHEANVNTENTQGWTGNLPLYFVCNLSERLYLRQFSFIIHLHCTNGRFISI